MILKKDIFLSKAFAVSLLLAHIVVLISFLIYKWNRHNPAAPTKPKAPLSPDYILLVLASSNLIGIVFARSLHYQFYVWYFHTLPFLLWKTKLPVLVRIALLIGVEICWNTYPSTTWSSLLLFWCHAIILLSVALADFLPSQRKTHKTR